MKYKILDWDSSFFGFGVAAIYVSSIELFELNSILLKLKKENVRLVYLSVDKKFHDDEISLLNGFFVDEKTTFAIDFSCVDFKFDNIKDVVEPFCDEIAISDLEGLAVQSGRYSRFAIDPIFPKDKFISLYKTWIRNSVNRTAESEVFVVKDSGSLAGMVTLNKYNDCGNIGLIAVDDEFRGRGFGMKLVKAAQDWFINNDCSCGKVVTQGVNEAACNLYEKCGYVVNDRKYFYHFWI